MHRKPAPLAHTDPAGSLWKAAKYGPISVSQLWNGFFMKKILVCLIGAASALAFAATEFKNVPEPLHKSLGNHGLKTAQLDKGVLRLQMDKPVITELLYSSFIFNGICAEQWRNPERFATLALTRVELLDAAGAQGFAFDAKGDACVQMGEMGKNFRAFISERTVACNAGVCPQRP